MSRSAALGSALLSCVVLVLATRDLRPPSPAPIDAPSTEFAADRAFEHVLRIAAKPHPMGSVEHGRVRESIVEAFRRLGLEVTQDEGVVTRRPIQAGDGAHVACVTNVVARLRGSGSTGRDVVLAAHYDSVPTGPGAGDDAAAVAALIEVARALREGPPLANDVVFLITDGEEVGLYGAKLAVADPAFLARTALVLNFEARGHRGPVVMFQTFGAVEPWVDALAQVDDPVAYSLAADVYAQMPNDTDLSVFGRAGLPGMNFAFIGGHSHYHTPLDSPDELDRGSLQHHGQYALSLARHFGAADLAASGIGAKRVDDEQVYFSLWRVALVHWPAAWASPIAYGVLGLAVLTLVLAIARRRTCLGSFTLDVLAIAVALVVPAGLTWFEMERGSDGAHEFATAARIYAPERILLASVLASLAIVVLIVRWRTRGVLPLAVGMVFSVAGVVVAARQPAGSVLSFVAFPIVVIELARVLHSAQAATRAPSVFGRLGIALGAAVVVGVVVPLAVLLPSAIGPHTNPLGAALVVLAALATLRTWGELVVPRPTLIAVGLGVAALAVSVPTLLAPFDAQWPEPVESIRASVESTENGWSATVVDDRNEGDSRRVVVKMVPPLGCWRSSVTLQRSDDAGWLPIARAAVLGFDARNIERLWLDAPPAAGFEVEVLVPVGLEFSVIANGFVPTTGTRHPLIRAHPIDRFAKPNDPDGLDVRTVFKF
ncbi:MAG: M20/M25/M40 family metallo-hydrolase [Planctomycetes bacterium]|nr:M20/M25/M40 family metallo-hydrolase [Planctomycetota bacterium]MCC7171357.1 M20/M25/M40 family metallo-hydrolase [Planctomycetota bacterium]